jgi:hypothetical protein
METPDIDIEPICTLSGDNDDTHTILSSVESDAETETESTVTAVDLLPMSDRFTDSEMCNMEQQIKEVIDDYMNEHMLRVSSPAYIDTFISEIVEYLLNEWSLAGICTENDMPEITELVRQIQIEYFDMREIPFREEPTVGVNRQPREDVDRKLKHLCSIEQPEQRTPEWYTTRYNLITASNAWKIFGTQAQYNSLVYDKCKPLEISKYGPNGICVDSDNSLQYGIRYEPLSILLYEAANNTKVRDVGCIPHTTYPYMGASPDGIIMDEESPIYGRMIEVKNIVNREITGIPLESYWIQMQLQMEVCDLDECDFIETRFKQYDNLNEMPFNETDTRKKGIILYFYPFYPVRKEGEPMPTYNLQPEYVYMPLHISVYDSVETEKWIREQCRLRVSHILYRTTYWALEQYSCILVRRNREWFRYAQPKIQETWDTILRERVSGYDHRAPQPLQSKQKKKLTEVICSADTTTHYIRNMPLTNTICVKKLE